MSLDTTNAFVIGGASALAGFGLAYLAFKKFIADRYGKGKQDANPNYFWCGIIAMIAVGQGTGTILNEIGFSLTNNASINGNVIGRGVITVIFYPMLIALVAFIISKFTKKKIEVVSSQPNFELKQNLNDATATVNSSSRNILLITITLGVALVGYVVYDGGLSFAKEKKFDVVECESCRWTFAEQNRTCKKFTAGSNGLQHITVFENKVVSYSKRTDGTSGASESPGSDEKCIFNPNGKFSFNCQSITNDSIQMFQSTSEFDGKSSYQSTWKWYITVQGEPRLAEDSKLVCKMKGN
jgi:hypothetical protein